MAASARACCPPACGTSSPTGSWRRPATGLPARGRDEYRLTDKGRSLLPILIALNDWAERWIVPDGAATISLLHHECGSPVRTEVTCASGHDLTAPSEVVAAPGPGAKPASVRLTVSGAREPGSNGHGVACVQCCDRSPVLRHLGVTVSVGDAADSTTAALRATYPTGVRINDAEVATGAAPHHRTRPCCPIPPLPACPGSPPQPPVAVDRPGWVNGLSPGNGEADGYGRDGGAGDPAAVRTGGGVCHGLA
ncbi:winged helix-turn-helix transcriptional regulator [Streptomyces sp. NPDC096046]|uniref:winged helix-turn-helix transcriptional regulator n=1 Tax=Streptomyces sp. NPDC096046 TaxID=3155542 RepID=UPI003318672E